VSSDALRAVVGSGEADLDASAEAFAVLELVVAARLRRRLTVVVDTLGLDHEVRSRWLQAGRAAGIPCVAVLFETPAELCRERNARRDRPVPARALAHQLTRAAAAEGELAAEDWDQVVVERGQETDQPPTTPRNLARAASGASMAKAAGAGATAPKVVLQLSRFPWREDPAGWVRAVGLAAAEVGVAGVALMDHLIQIPQVDRAWEPIPEPWVTLGLLAGLDTDLELGTLVSPVTFRPAGIIAKTVATLDVLSGGRAFLGLGAGWWEREHLAFGLPFPPAPERFDRLEATIETVRALWGPGTKAHAGDRVTLPETTAYPRPLRPPSVLVGGSGQRRTLRIAAELADGCNLPSDLDRLDQLVGVLHRHCRAVGRDPDEVAVTVLDVPVVGRDRDDTWRRVERLRGRTSAAAYARLHHAGEPASHVERYRKLAERGVRTVFVALPDLEGPEDLERLAPVLDGLRRA